MSRANFPGMMPLHPRKVLLHFKEAMFCVSPRSHAKRKQTRKDAWVQVIYGSSRVPSDMGQDQTEKKWINDCKLKYKARGNEADLSLERQALQAGNHSHGFHIRGKSRKNPGQTKGK